MALPVIPKFPTQRRQMRSDSQHLLQLSFDQDKIL